MANSRKVMDITRPSTLVLRPPQLGDILAVMRACTGLRLPDFFGDGYCALFSPLARYLDRWISKRSLPRRRARRRRAAHRSTTERPHSPFEGCGGGYGGMPKERFACSRRTCGASKSTETFSSGSHFLRCQKWQAAATGELRSTAVAENNSDAGRAFDGDVVSLPRELGRMCR